MADIYDLAHDARQALINGDQATAERLARAYADSYGRMEARLRSLQVAIDANGGRATPAELARLDAWKQLLDGMDQELDYLARFVGDQATRQQIDAIHLAHDTLARQTQDTLTANQFQSFDLPSPAKAINELAGNTAIGPLADLLDQAGADTAAKIKQALINGIASGQNPRKTAKDVRAVWDAGAARALAIARTETMRAYREATRAAYQANSDIIGGWVWVAARSPRTCPACLALDGKRFPLNQPQPAHVQCRCTMIPMVKGRDLPPRQTGTDWFDDQPDPIKALILGQKGWAAYQDGAELGQFVHMHSDPVWGDQALWRVPN